jgi:hypothetical protein
MNTKHVQKCWMCRNLNCEPFMNTIGTDKLQTGRTDADTVTDNWQIRTRAWAWSMDMNLNSVQRTPGSLHFFHGHKICAELWTSNTKECENYELFMNTKTCAKVQKCWVLNVLNVPNVYFCSSVAFDTAFGTIINKDNKNESQECENYELFMNTKLVQKCKSAECAECAECVFL